MAKKKTGHATWFKLFLHHRELLTAAPPECAIKAVIASLDYLETGQLPEDLEPMAAVVFAALKPAVDESTNTYRKASEAGKTGNDKRWGKDRSGGDTYRYDPIQSDRGVSGGIEKIEDRSTLSSKDKSSAPGSDAGGQSKLHFDVEEREWRRGP